MRIESITVHNIRQLRDIELRFGKNTGKRDLHVILAENGIGKTNIVNAITWCLYSKEPHLRNESTALPIVNTQYINDIRKIGGGQAEISVSLEISIDETNDRITIKHQGYYNVTETDVLPISDEQIITMKDRGGIRIVKDKEEIAQIIHKHLPEEINNYIFFDGEQLEDFFSKNQIEKIQKGINELTQASYLEKASTFLRKYVNSDIIPKYKEADDEELIKQQNKVDEIKEEIRKNEETIIEIDGQIAKSKNKINDLTKKIRGFEDLKEKIDELEKLETDIDSIQTRLNDKNKELIVFTRNNYSLMAIYPSLKVFYDFIKEQDNKGKLPPRVDKKLLIEILSSKHCPFCNTDHLDEEHLEHVRRLEASLAVASATSSVLNRALGHLSTYKSKIDRYDSEKKKLISDRDQIKSELDEKDVRYQELNKYLQTIPEENEIVDAINKRLEFIALQEDLLVKKGKEESAKENNKTLLQEAELRLQALVKKHSELEKYERGKIFCEKCASIMDNCKDDILTECRLRIQEETFAIFCNLIWKKEYFSKIVINEDYSFELLDMYGNQCIGSCSAAETALLALSFTLALQNVSKHDALLFIDTPIGRVGKENRKNIMETLLEVSKDKQVILTFTPTEYDVNVQSILSTMYSSFHELDMNKEGVTINI